MRGLLAFGAALSAALIVTAAAAPTLSRGAVEFVDVTASAGIHFTHVNGAFGKRY
jgi:hypothetical protein